MRSSRQLVVLLGMPWMGLGTEGSARWTNGLYEAFCILVCFPLIVAMGAGSSVKGSKSTAINKFLGDISYPIYITHYPLIYMQMSWVDSHKDAPLSLHIFVPGCIFLLTILVAYDSYKLYAPRPRVAEKETVLTISPEPMTSMADKGLSSKSKITV